MLKKVRKYIDKLCRSVMLLHTYIHTGLTPKIQYIREEVCLLFKHISFLYTSFRKGGSLVRIIDIKGVIYV